VAYENKDEINVSEQTGDKVIELVRREYFSKLRQILSFSGNRRRQFSAYLLARLMFLVINVYLPGGGIRSY